MSKQERIETSVEFQEGIWGPKGKVVIPVENLVEIIMHALGDDKERVRQFLTFFTFDTTVRDIIVEQLIEEYSSPNFNPRYHEERKRLMEAIPDKEIYFLASELAGKIEDGERERRAYWDLYHAARDHAERSGCNFYKTFEEPRRPEIDFDARRACEAMLESFMKERKKP